MSLTFGLIVGNRDFFPDELARIGREDMIKILQKEDFSVICPSPEDTRFGVVETWEDAKKRSALFKENQEKIDGIIVSLPNFSDEKTVANTIRLSGLEMPVFVHAFPDDLDALDIPHRRDSFCGKIKSGPFTYARFTTDDLNGCLRAYVGEGQVTEDELNTFGARGVVHIPRMQDLSQFICNNGFEHHVAINLSNVATIFNEAISNYFGTKTYWHR